MTQTRLFKKSGVLFFSFDYLILSKNRLFRFSLLILLVSVLSAGCSYIPPTDFYEVDGILSGEINDTLSAAGWESIHFINSRGLSYSPSDTSGRKPFSFSIYISNPGNYSFWLLAAFPGHIDSKSMMDISFSGPDNFLVSRATVALAQQNRLTWERAVNDSDSNLISFDQAGQYSVSITPRNSDDVQIHKFQMSLNNSVRPFGLGLPSSKITDLSASDLFKELPVMLPPSWVFKPVIGLNTDYPEAFYTDSTFHRLLNSDKLGAVWVDGEHERLPGIISAELEINSTAKGINSQINECFSIEAETLFESGIEFFVTQNSPGLDCLNHLHKTYQQVREEDRRSVLFHGIRNAFKSDLKQFPAPVTPLYDFKWSSQRFVDGDIYHPGGYQELIDDVSDPAASLYNMPFLSFPINYPAEPVHSINRDSELFIRSIQLSAFLPVMHLIFPENFHQLSELERKHLQKAIELRNSLFPYTYTHAHYTRQTNRSVITGFREYPDQYLYGNAFLVAPVTTPGSDGRLVYFPEGRRWYNYHTGEAYEAGQSWFVGTSLNYLPLFVKAGSVIPFINGEDSNNLKLDIYTGDAGAFRLVEDDGIILAYRRAEAARTMFRYNEISGNLKLTIGAVQAEFDGMSNYRSYNIHFKYTVRPDSIEVSGEKLLMSQNSSGKSSWRYDENSKSIILDLNNKSRREKIDIVIYR